MAGRRQKSDGSVTFLSDRGVYRGRIQSGVSENGTPVYVYFRDKRKSEVLRLMDEWRLVHGATIPASVSSLQANMNTWLTVVKKPNMKPGSYDRLESTIRNQIDPRVGKYAPTQITDAIIKTEVIDEMTSEGLSLSSVHKAYDALNGFFAYAEYRGIVSKNPMGMMKKPTRAGFAPAANSSVEDSPEGEIEPLDDAEIMRIVSASSSLYGNGVPLYPMGAAVSLLLNTGLRIGECLALKWSDVDLTKRTLSVTKNIMTIKNRDANADSKTIVVVQDTPKTRKSRRVLPLSNAAINALNILRMSSYDINGFIVHTRNNKPMSQTNFDRMLNSICKKAQVRKIGAHTLRHTYATKLFEAGIDVKVISELLGHSSTEITYRIYVHVVERLKKTAVDAVIDIG